MKKKKKETSYQFTQKHGKKKDKLVFTRGFSHSSFSKESACNAGDLDSIPGSGTSPGEGNDNPL